MATDVKLENDAQLMVNYLKKYAPKHEISYVNLHDLAHHHTLDHIYPDMEWHYVVEFAWKQAYRLAWADNTLSLEERDILNNLNRLSLTYKNTPVTRVALNHKILLAFKNLLEIDLKEDSYEHLHENKYKEEPKVEREWLPRLKPTPWDNQ